MFVFFVYLEPRTRNPLLGAFIDASSISHPLLLPLARTLLLGRHRKNASLWSAGLRGSGFCELLVNLKATSTFGKHAQSPHIPESVVLGCLMTGMSRNAVVEFSTWA